MSVCAAASIALPGCGSGPDSFGGYHGYGWVIYPALICAGVGIVLAPTQLHGSDLLAWVVGGVAGGLAGLVLGAILWGVFG